MLAPAWPPAIPDLPVSDAPAHYQRKVIAFDSRRALLEDAALVIPPQSSIHSHHHWPAFQSLRQLAATGDFVVIMQMVVFFGVGGLALEGTGIVDGAEIGVILIWRDAVVLEVIVDVLRRGVLQAGGTAVYHLLL